MGKFYSDTIKIPKPPYECVSTDRPSALIFLHKKRVQEQDITVSLVVLVVCRLV